MEPDDEGQRRRRLHRILAAHVLAALRDVEPPTMQRTQRLEPAVMARLQPMGAARLLALHLDLLGPSRPEPIRPDLRRTGVGDHQRRMRGGRPQRVPPFAHRSRRRATVDDEPVAPDRQLERQRAGMGTRIQPHRWGSAGIHDQHAPPPLAGGESHPRSVDSAHGSAVRPAPAQDRPGSRSPLSCR